MKALAVEALTAMLGGCAAVAPPPVAGADHSTDMHMGIPGRCEVEAQNGGGAEGCFVDTIMQLGTVPAEVYWHIDGFADVATANAAKTSTSAVVTALGGQVFLETVNADREWRASGGKRLATVGPMQAPQGTAVSARLMEGTTSGAGGSTFPHVHPGPEGFYLLNGSICVETPAGTTKVRPGGAAWLAGGVPMQLRSNGGSVRRSLMIVLHPSNQPWVDRHPNWTSRGLCSGKEGH